MVFVDKYFFDIAKNSNIEYNPKIIRTNIKAKLDLIIKKIKINNIKEV